MSNTARDTVAAGNPFLTLSKIYLSSLEDISSLNLKVAREALEDCTSATKVLSAPMAGKDYAKCMSGLGQPMFEKAVAHSREMYGLMVKTQNEMTAVIGEQLAHPQMAWPGVGDWSELSGMFTKGLQQFTANATQSLAAATDASGKAIAATRSSEKKAA